MNREQWGSFAIGLLAGAAIGGVIALLYAPKSGKETRDFIREKVGNLRHSFGEKLSGEKYAPIGDGKQT